jgi:putative DNA primase/helicase
VHRALDRSLGAIDAGTPAGLRPSLAALADEASKLDAVDRELLRRAAVEAYMKLGVADPRSLVAAALRNGNSSQDPVPSLAGRALVLQDVELWPEPVDGGQLLDAIHQTIRRYVVLEKAGVVAVTLWVVHAHAHDAAQVSPLLSIKSPVKGSGKTTLLTVMSALVPRPLGSANLTPAALFRAIETYRPTLLIDEADTFLAMREELRGLLNSGHTRPFAVAVRTIGDEHEVRAFSTWAPKAIALIGTLPDTLADRSILIPMRRKTKEEQVEPIRVDRLYDQLADLRRQAARWASDHLDALRRADPAVLHGLSNRAADNWRPLFAIADLVGGVWPEDARLAAQALSDDPQSRDQSVETTLLADLKTLFDERGSDRLATGVILTHLTGLEDRPWPEWAHGRPLSARGLAKLLSRFGIQPQKWRDGTEIVRGYTRDQFGDAWRRYLSATSATAKPSNDLHVALVADVADVPGADA